MLTIMVVMILFAKVLVHMVNEHHRSVLIVGDILDLNHLSSRSVRGTDATQTNR